MTGGWCSPLSSLSSTHSQPQEYGPWSVFYRDPREQPYVRCRRGKVLHSQWGAIYSKLILSSLSSYFSERQRNLRFGTPYQYADIMSLLETATSRASYSTQEDTEMHGTPCRHRGESTQTSLQKRRGLSGPGFQKQHAYVCTLPTKPPKVLNARSQS